MCNYWHGGTIECRGDGYMWDADNDGYDEEDHSMPCPACNTAGYFDEAKEVAETTSYMSSYNGGMSGDDVWRNAIRIACEANPECAPKVLRTIGIVRPIIDHPTDKAAWIEKVYDHRNMRFLVSRIKREGAFAKRIASGGGNGEA
jgi:hypothetical protein